MNDELLDDELFPDGFDVDEPVRVESDFGDSDSDEKDQDFMEIKLSQIIRFLNRDVEAVKLIEDEEGLPRNHNTLIEQLWRSLPKGGTMTMSRALFDRVQVPVLRAKYIEHEYQLAEKKLWIIFEK